MYTVKSANFTFRLKTDHSLSEIRSFASSLSSKTGKPASIFDDNKRCIETVQF